MSERLRPSAAPLTSWQRAARLISVMCGMFVTMTIVMTVVDVARFQHRMATPGDFAVLRPGALLHAFRTRPNAFIGLFNLWLGPYLFSLLFAALVRATGWSRSRPLAAAAIVAAGCPTLLLAIIASHAREPHVTWSGVIAFSYLTVIGLSVWWALFGRSRARVEAA